MITTQNTYAIYAMCAIVITLYALRNSEAHYLPDLLGLALALAAPRQSYAIGAVLILAIIRHSGLSHGLADSVPNWLLVVVLPGARNMSIPDDDLAAHQTAPTGPLLQRENELQYIEIPQPVAEIAPESILLAQSEVIARLVISGEVGKTKAIQVGAGAKSGKRYQRLSRLVESEIERQRNHYPPGSTHKRYE